MSSEEVQAIESIYCGDGEFEIYEKGIFYHWVCVVSSVNHIGRLGLDHF